jgi:glycosyltransferase involved in cell wall biosynthesis
MAPIKGLRDLVEAFRLAALPGASLDLVGGAEGLLKGWLERIDTPGVRCLGSVPYQEVGRLCRQAHVLVVPSIEDGFGMVVLEAMASATPVIATENVGAAEWIRDGVDGFVVPIRSPSAIAERLTRLHQDRQLAARLGESAAARVRGMDWAWYGRQLRRCVLGRRAGVPVVPVLPQEEGSP